MATSTSNNRRLVSNTFFLTFRMLLLMFVSFFTARVILDKLGVVDYGIYHVVGGLTSLFVFFRSSLANVTQRYLNVELANNNIEGASKVFSRHQTLYLLISIGVVVLLETVGLWFLYNKLVIPEERLTAAFWVFQFMVFSLVVTLLSVVYDAEIIAHENFKIYAYVGLYEGIAKLGLALALTFFPYDRLITYSFLVLLVTLSIRVFYSFFCKRHYDESTFRLDYNVQSFRDAFSMIGWNTVGTAVYAINTQGMDILLNIFFGPIVNAAKGIATAVNHALLTFSTSFTTSTRPQLVKTYATGDEKALMNLFYRSSKFGFFIMWSICLPVMLCMDSLLSIWLKEVPEHASSFAQLVLCYSLVNVFSNPIWSLILAVGKLKKYVLIGSAVFLMSFPISYVFLRIGSPPEAVFIVNAVVRAVYIVVAFFILRSYIPISGTRFLKEVIQSILIVIIISGLLSFFIKGIIHHLQWNWIVVLGSCFLLTVAVVWCCGLKTYERQFFASMIKDKNPLKSISKIKK